MRVLKTFRTRVSGGVFLIHVGWSLQGETGLEKTIGGSYLQSGVLMMKYG